MTVRRHRMAPQVASLTAAVLIIMVACCSSTTTDSSTSGPAASDPGTASTTTAPTHATGPSDGCKATPAEPGSTSGAISSGGKDRIYQFDIPDGYDGTKPYPLVFALHSLS